jgi:hypothetical protein
MYFEQLYPLYYSLLSSPHSSTFQTVFGLLKNANTDVNSWTFRPSKSGRENLTSEKLNPLFGLMSISQLARSNAV